VVSAQWSSNTLWGRYLAEVECEISLKVAEHQGLIARPLQSPDLTVGFLPLQTPERAHLCSPSQAYQKSCSKTSSSCDSG
jgi:hypothetical protein